MVMVGFRWCLGRALLGARLSGRGLWHPLPSRRVMVLRQQREETSGSSPKHYQSFGCTREEKGNEPELHPSKVIAVSVTFPDADIRPSLSSNVGSSALRAEGCRVPRKCPWMRDTARTQGPVKCQRPFSWHSWIRCQWVPNPSGTPLTAPLCWPG